MHKLLVFLYIPLLAFFDRWGGGGFEFISPRIPDLLKRGFLAIRRFGIPIALFLLSTTLVNAVLCGALCILLCLNEDYIEDKNWYLAFTWSGLLTISLYSVCGIFALLPAGWWLLGIYLSNNGPESRKLPWQYVELLRGAFIGLGAFLYAL